MRSELKNLSAWSSCLRCLRTIYFFVICANPGYFVARLTPTLGTKYRIPLLREWIFYNRRSGQELRTLSDMALSRASPQVNGFVWKVVLINACRRNNASTCLQNTKVLLLNLLWWVSLGHGCHRSHQDCRWVSLSAVLHSNVRIDLFIYYFNEQFHTRPLFFRIKLRRC